MLLFTKTKISVQNGHKEQIHMEKKTIEKENTSQSVASSLKTRHPKNMAVISAFTHAGWSVFHRSVL